MEVLENRENHALVRTDDGDVELIPWSAENKLVYEHGLEGLIHEKNEVLSLFRDDDKPDVTILPAEDDDAEFLVVIDELELPIRAQERQTLLDTLADAYGDDGDPDVEPFYDLAEKAMDTEVPKHVADKFVEMVSAAIPDGANVEVEEDGWLINDHLLLTYDLDLQHPTVAIEEIYEDAERMGANDQAYDLRLSRSVGQSDLTDFSWGASTGPLIEFLSKALWAGSYTPTMV